MNPAMSTAPVRATPADMSTATPSASVKAILAASSSPPATSAGSMDATRDADDGEGQELKELLKRRKDLVDQRVQERNRLEKGLSGGARRSTERHIEWLDEEIARMDEEYRKALRESAKLSETAALYRSVPGVGEVTIAGGLSTGVGEVRGEGIDGPGGPGAVVEGQWRTARASLYPRRTGCSASRVVPGGIVGDTPQRGAGTLLPWSCGSGGRQGKWRW